MLAASPALSLGPEVISALTQDQPPLVTSPADAINVFDFEGVARKKLPPAHFGYLATGTDDDATLRANRDGYARYALRVRRLVDVRQVDPSVTLFGTRWATPIALAPVSSHRAFHPEGELAVARAARAKGHLQILSTATTTPIEQVNEARGEPVWFQLYPTDQWSVTEGLVRRAAAAGCTVMVLTVDLHPGSNRETLARAKRVDPRDCTKCHATDPLRSALGWYRKPMFRGLVDARKVTRLAPLDMTWDVIPRLRERWAGKLLLKGIVTKEDAELAATHGVDGVIVSNHGGRAEESGRGTIECLSDVVEGIGGRIPVLLDGGIRRGTDILKALALGADAVGIGRPYAWGLAAFGQPGVEAVLTMLKGEFELAMRQAGAVRTGDIRPSLVIER